MGTSKEYKKKWAEENKERIKEQQKKYYEENKERLKEYQRSYKKEHPDLIKKRRKDYYENNKEIYSEKMKEYYENNKEQITQYKKDWYDKNKEYIKERHLKRLNDDPIYAMKLVIRKNICKSFKRNGFDKNNKTEIIIGCTFVEFKSYIESKFEP